MEKYDYLEREPIDTAYGIDGMVRERRTNYKEIFDKSIIAGVILCIVGAAVMVTAGVVSDSFDDEQTMICAAGLCTMLALIAVGVYIIVRSSMVMGGFDRLLEEKDFSRQKKKERKRGSIGIVGIYWIVLVAVFLGVSFLTNGWNRSWIIFAVGGVLTPVVSAIESAVKNKKENR